MEPAKPQLEAHLHPLTLDASSRRWSTRDEALAQELVVQARGCHGVDRSLRMEVREEEALTGRVCRERGGVRAQVAVSALRDEEGAGYRPHHPVGHGQRVKVVRVGGEHHGNPRTGGQANDLTQVFPVS